MQEGIKVSEYGRHFLYSGHMKEAVAGAVKDRGMEVKE
jgi:hypothetical protein